MLLLRAAIALLLVLPVAAADIGPYPCSATSQVLQLGGGAEVIVTVNDRCEMREVDGETERTTARESTGVAVRQDGSETAFVGSRSTSEEIHSPDAVGACEDGETGVRSGDVLVGASQSRCEGDVTFFGEPMHIIQGTERVGVEAAGSHAGLYHGSFQFGGARAERYGVEAPGMWVNLVFVVHEDDAVCTTTTAVETFIVDAQGPTLACVDGVPPTRLLA